MEKDNIVEPLKNNAWIDRLSKALAARMEPQNQRITELEKKVAALEGRIQERPKKITIPLFLDGKRIFEKTINVLDSKTHANI